MHQLSRGAEKKNNDDDVINESQVSSWIKAKSEEISNWSDSLILRK